MPLLAILLTLMFVNVSCASLLLLCREAGVSPSGSLPDPRRSCRRREIFGLWTSRMLNAIIWRAVSVWKWEHAGHGVAGCRGVAESALSSTLRVLRQVLNQVHENVNL